MSQTSHRKPPRRLDDVDLQFEPLLDSASGSTFTNPSEDPSEVGEGWRGDRHAGRQAVAVSGLPSQRMVSADGGLIE